MGTQTFTYDVLNRLLSATRGSETQTYTYDEIGNMTSNSQVGAYVYPSSGATTVRPHAVVTAGSQAYTYDANGNLLSGAGRTVTYCRENRVLSVTRDGVTTTFTYDGDGQRIKKLVNGITTTYVNELYECEGSVCVKYLFANGRRIAMQQVSTGPVSYVHADHLGSTSVVTAGSGSPAPGNQEEALTYYPYGAARTRTGIANVPYQYTGQALDPSTGLYNYKARLYDPVLGRFLSADTIVPEPTNPQDLNRYSYVRNNPLRYTDPTGHNSVCDQPGGSPVCDDYYLSNPSTDVEVLLRMNAVEIRASRLAGQQTLTYFDLVSAMDWATRGGAAPSLFGGIGTPTPADTALQEPLVSPGDVGGLGSALKFLAIGAMKIGAAGANKTLQHLTSILKPGGKLIGEAGVRPGIRVLSGDLKAAEDLALDLGKIGQIRNHPKDPGGVAFDLPGGGFVGLRESKEFGPTIDIKVPGFPEISKLHFK